jgi:hypothetical protein
MQPQAAIQKTEQFGVMERMTGGVSAMAPTDSLESQLTKIVEKLWARGKESRARRHNIWAQAELFSKGVHFFTYSDKDCSYEQIPRSKVSMYTPIPLLQQQVEMIAAEYSKSKPRIIPHVESDNRKKQLVARELQPVADSLFQSFYLADPDRRQREAKLAPLRDMVYILIEYDKGAGEEIELPQYEQSQGQTGNATCADCGYEVEGQKPICPHCGSENIEQPEPLMGIANKGATKVKQGKPKKTVVDAFCVDTNDRRFDLEDVTYLRYDEILYKSEAEELYPHIGEIKGKASLGNSEKGYNGLHTLEQLETIIANSGALDQSKTHKSKDYFGGNFLDEDRCIRSRVWLRPVEYRKVVAPVPTQIPGTAYLVPGGTKYAPMYPDGCILHLINDEIVLVERGVLDSNWVAYRYSVATTGMYGSGVSNLVSLNRGYDELTSFTTQYALMASLGILVVDDRMQDFQNIPGRINRYKDRRRDEKIGDSFAQISPSPMSPVVEGLRQSFKADLADASMARNPNNSSLTEDGMQTATGVRYQNATANAITAPKLELFAAAAAQVVGKAIKLDKENNVHPRYYGKFGETVGAWFDPGDIPDEITFIPEEDSHQPRTMEDRRADVMGYVGAGGGSGKLAPHIEESLAKEFRQPTGQDDYDSWSVKAETRFDRIKESEGELSSLPAEMTEAAMMELAMTNMPPTPEVLLLKAANALPQPLDAHEMFIRYYKTEVYLSEQWDKLSEMVQGAIVQLVSLHETGTALEMQKKVEQEQVAMEPVRAQQMEDEARGQEQAAMQAEQEGMQGEAERAATSEESERNRQHQLQMQREKQTGAETLAKMKPKGKSK